MPKKIKNRPKRLDDEPEPVESNDNEHNPEKLAAGDEVKIPVIKTEKKKKSKHDELKSDLLNADSEEDMKGSSAVKIDLTSPQRNNKKPSESADTKTKKGNNKKKNYDKNKREAVNDSSEETIDQLADDVDEILDVNRDVIGDENFTGPIEDQAAVVDEGKAKMSKKEMKKLKKQADFQKQLDLEGDTSSFSLSQAESSARTVILDSKDIKVDRFSISARGKDLFVNASLYITAGRRYGLVGPNGSVVIYLFIDYLSSYT